MRRSIQTIKPGSGVKVTFDGNSLVSGVGASSFPLPTAFSALAGATAISNLGISGQAWNDLVNNATDVDAAWDASKTNVLFAWETTNSVFNNGSTVQQVITLATNYAAARRAAHPDIRIVMITSLPRETGVTVTDQANRTERNQANDAVDAYFRQNFRAAGYDAIVDIRRPGSPFILPDYTSASFAVENGMWAEGAGTRVHLNDTGYQWVARQCWETFKRLRLR